jgi:cysteine sulfinate desulfinase/cysteine desulfurase-like protein
MLGAGGSRTLRAIGLTPQLADSSLRFSFDRTTSKGDLKKLVNVLVKVVKKLRDFEPKTIKKVRASK